MLGVALLCVFHVAQCSSWLLWSGQGPVSRSRTRIVYVNKAASYTRFGCLSLTAALTTRTPAPNTPTSHTDSTRAQPTSCLRTLLTVAKHKSPITRRKSITQLYNYVHCLTHLNHSPLKRMKQTPPPPHQPCFDHHTNRCVIRCDQFTNYKSHTRCFSGDSAACVAVGGNVSASRAARVSCRSFPSLFWPLPSRPQPQNTS